jgi:hypothetical protein
LSIRKPALNWKIPARRVKHANRVVIVRVVIAAIAVVRVQAVVAAAATAIAAPETTGAVTAVIVLPVPRAAKVAVTPITCRLSSSLKTEAGVSGSDLNRATKIKGGCCGGPLFCVRGSDQPNQAAWLSACSVAMTILLRPCSFAT